MKHRRRSPVKLVPRRPKKYTFASPHPQKFSLPQSIMYYITMRPCSPRGFQKLQKTCKYFYSKNQVIVCESVTIWDRKDCTFINRNSYLAHIDILKKLYKIWITSSLTMRSFNVSKTFDRIFRFDAESIALQYRDIYFNELSLFATSPKLTRVSLYKVNILNSDESMAPLENVYEMFPKLVDFR